MRWQGILSLAVSAVGTVNAIYADDAFNIDYHHALLGVPQSHTTFFHKPQISSNASLIYSISDKAVLGAVNPRDGSLIWRQVLAQKPETSTIIPFLVGGQNGQVCSGFNSTIAAWDAQDGRLVWDKVLPVGHVVKGLQAAPAVSADSNAGLEDVILLAGPEKDSTGAAVSRIGSDAQASKWEFKDSSISYDASISIATSAEHVYYISKSSGILSSSKTKVVVLDIASGQEIAQYTLSLDSEPLGEAGSYVISSCAGSPLLASSEKPYKSLKLNLLGTSKLSTINLEWQGEEVEKVSIHAACGGEAVPRLLVHSQSKTSERAEVYQVDLKSGEAKKTYSIASTVENSLFSAANVGNAAYFMRLTRTSVGLYSSDSNEQLTQWPLTTKDKDMPSSWSHAALEVSDRGKNGLALRATVLSTDGEWSLIRNGEAQWSRPEMLAYITKAVWADDAPDDPLVQEIEAEASSNPLTAYIMRLTRHAQDLTHLPLYLKALPESFLNPSDESDAIREKLVGGKLVLAATSRHELFALDAAHLGSVKWRVDLTKTTAASSTIVHMVADPERLTAYVSDGSIVVVNIATGQLLEVKKATDSFHKIIELPGAPSSTIVQIDAQGVPRVFSDLAPAVPSEGNAILTINEKGEAIGWTVGASIEKTWTIKPPVGAKFTEVIARPDYDPVASIGVVLGDRSVLYKYLTPNLALLTALSSTAATFYLVNAVTGAVLHTSSHEGILPGFPVPAVMSENWVAYSFTTRDPATTGLSTQMVVSELYESAIPNDRGSLLARTNYSSFAPDAGAAPHVISQSFTLVASLSDMTVTQTLQGITSRHVVAVVPDLGAIVAIPRDVLNARRPVGRDATSLEAEEGLFRYSPMLEVDPKGFLSHARELVGIKKAMATSTLLESTSMVFAFGHDVFGIQVAPSTTFDVLGKSFKRFQLILTIVALYAGVLFLRPMVRKRMVDGHFRL